MTAKPLTAFRRSPLGIPVTETAQLTLREVPYLTQVNLRLDSCSAAADRIAEVLGCALPTTANTVTTMGTQSVLWLGPDEWLIVGPDGDGPTLEAVLRQALRGEHGAVVDVSANRTTLELSGPAARDVLEQCCSLDLHPRAFHPGQCAQTLLARANVILHQIDELPTYRIGVRGSFAEYVAEWLLDAMVEFNDDPGLRFHVDTLYRR